MTKILAFAPRNYNLNRPRKVSVMKNWIGMDKLYDFSYNLASKYIPILLIVMMTITVMNRIYVPMLIDCKYLNPDEPETMASQNALNNYCWLSNIHIVRKPLNPEMSGNLTYAGNDDYNPEKDIIIQHYYSNLVLYLFVLLFVAYVPHWQFKLREKRYSFCMGDLPRGDRDLPSNNGRRTVTEKFLDAFPSTYSSKVLAIVTATFQIGFTILFFGDMFLYYGFDFLLYTLGHGPNPMDAVFPKVAKCSVCEYFEAVNIIEVKAAICKLPLNIVTQYLFVIYWWAIVSSLILNIWNLFALLVKICYIANSKNNVTTMTAIPPLTNQKVNAEIQSVTKFMKNGKGKQLQFPDSELPKFIGEEQKVPNSESVNCDRYARLGERLLEIYLGHRP